MQGLKDLLSTEHGIFGVLLIIAATVLCALGIMTIDDWKSFAQVIFVTFAGAHAVVTGTETIASALPRATIVSQAPPAPPPPAPPAATTGGAP
jgi:hypothetical protein